jgi:hypothetical protein
VTQLRKRLLAVGLSVLGGLVAATGVRSDTLFKGKQPLKIGIGKQEHSEIRWTDCQGRNPETDKVPPYSLDKADNCSVSPFTFGLQCDGESCRVVDEDKTQKYLPDAKNGEKVQLRIREHSVECVWQGTTLHLER